MQHQSTSNGVGALCLVALSFASLTPLAAAAADPLPGSDASRLVWQRKSHDLGEWPEGLTPEQIAVLEDWQGFAASQGMRMDLNRDGRVVVLSDAARNRSNRTWEQRIEDTLDSCDELFPWTAPSEAPGGIDRGAILGARNPGDGLVVLVRLKDGAQRDALVNDLLLRYPVLSDWAPEARSNPSFLLREPACAAWIEQGRNSVESASAECVNRLSHLLLQQRFGILPSWLEEGLGWTIEEEVNGRLASTPSIGDLPRDFPNHGFERELETHFGRGQQSPIAGADLLSWERGSWDERNAAMAWGACEHMRAMNPRAISGLCADLALARETLDWVQEGANGSWNHVPGEAWDPQEVELAIGRHAGPSARSEWAYFFGSGRLLPRAR